MIELSDIQRDALTEIFNIGVGRAADSLSRIVREEVLLSAPYLSLMPRSEAGDMLLGAEFDEFSTVSQIFTGPFDAQAMLIFPEQKALEIVRLMIGDHLSPAEVSEYEQEAMCEIGNIILNASMSALSDMLGEPFSSTLPEHRFGNSRTLPILADGGDHYLLVLQVDMVISQQCIQGHILFLLSISSIVALLDRINAYLILLGVTE